MNDELWRKGKRFHAETRRRGEETGKTRKGEYSTAEQRSQKREIDNFSEEIVPQRRRRDLYVETPSPKILSNAIGAAYSG
jgi:hypothetical protein